MFNLTIGCWVLLLRNPTYILLLVLIGFDGDTAFHQAEQVLSYFQLIELDQPITNLVIQLHREQIKKKIQKQPNEKVIQWKLPDAIKFLPPTTNMRGVRFLRVDFIIFMFDSQMMIDTQSCLTFKSTL